MATGLDAQQKIFSTNPDDRRAFEALEEHYFLEGDWDALVGLYRARIEAPSIAEDASQKSALLFRLNQLSPSRSGRVAKTRSKPSCHRSTSVGMSSGGS